VTTQYAFAPCLKVRNPKYLRIVYGYDYQQKDKYSKLIRSKKTDSKIKRSIYEAKLMQELLLHPLNTINVHNLSAQKILYQFLKESSELDPRL
jgi:hypothetical protein